MGLKNISQNLNRALNIKLHSPLEVIIFEDLSLLVFRPCGLVVELSIGTGVSKDINIIILRIKQSKKTEDLKFCIILPSISSLYSVRSTNIHSA